MEIHRLQGEEIRLANHVQSAAYEEDPATVQRQNAPLEAPGGDGLRERWGAFAPDGVLCSILEAHRLPVWFEGTQQMLCGIANVATLPAYRRRGAVRETFAAALAALRDEGFLLSYLYPFNEAYYRRFGYEMAEEVCEWTVPLAGVARAQDGGRVAQLFPGDDTSVVSTIAERMYAGYNAAPAKDRFDRKLNEDFWQQKRYLFVWYAPDGEAEGFLLAKRAESGVLDASRDWAAHNDFLATTPRAFRSLLSFVAETLPPRYRTLRFCTPAEFPVRALLQDGGGVSCRLSPNGMIRLLDVPKALRLCRCHGQGALTLAVTDPLLKGNNGVWELRFAQGRENEVRPVEGGADLTLPVSALSALLCGTRGADALPWMAECQVHNPCAPFGSVFYRKPAGMPVLF